MKLGDAWKGDKCSINTMIKQCFLVENQTYLVTSKPFVDIKYDMKFEGKKINFKTLKLNLSNPDCNLE